MSRAREIVSTVNGCTVRTVIHIGLHHEDSSTRWKRRNPVLARALQRVYNARWRKNNQASYRRAYMESNRKRAAR